MAKIEIQVAKLEEKVRSLEKELKELRDWTKNHLETIYGKVDKKGKGFSIFKSVIPGG